MSDAIHLCNNLIFVAKFSALIVQLCLLCPGGLSKQLLRQSIPLAAVSSQRLAPFNCLEVTHVNHLSLTPVNHMPRMYGPKGESKNY